MARNLMSKLSLEDELSSTVEPVDEVALAETQQECDNCVSEISDTVDDTEEAQELQSVLEDKDADLAAAQQEGATEMDQAVAIAAANEALSLVKARLGIQDNGYTVSYESYREGGTSLATAVRLSREGIKEVIGVILAKLKAVWDWIVDKVTKFITWIKNLFNSSKQKVAAAEKEVNETFNGAWKESAKKAGDQNLITVVEQAMAAEASGIEPEVISDTDENLGDVIVDALKAHADLINSTDIAQDAINKSNDAINKLKEETTQAEAKLKEILNGNSNKAKPHLNPKALHLASAMLSWDPNEYDEKFGHRNILGFISSTLKFKNGTNGRNGLIKNLAKAISEAASIVKSNMLKPTLNKDGKDIAEGSFSGHLMFYHLGKLGNYGARVRSVFSASGNVVGIDRLSVELINTPDGIGVKENSFKHQEYRLLWNESKGNDIHTELVDLTDKTENLKWMVEDINNHTKQTPNTLKEVVDELSNIVKLSDVFRSEIEQTINAIKISTKECQTTLKFDKAIGEDGINVSLYTAGVLVSYLNKISTWYIADSMKLLAALASYVNHSTNVINKYTRIAKKA